MKENGLEEFGVTDMEDVFSCSRENLEKALALVGGEEEKVLRLKYGFVDGRKHSFAEIAKNLNLPVEKVEELEKAGLRAFRKPEIAKYFSLLA